MPFGHKNAPGWFQAMMDKLLKKYLFNCCFVFIDDVIVYGGSERDVIANTRFVCEELFADGLKLGGLKCEFLLESVEILGHKVGNGCLMPQVEKL